MFRRYSDFEALRKNLRKYLPFHYIHPLPQKISFSESNTLMLNHRVQELNNFLNFLEEHQSLFNCDSFWKFFDVNLADTKITSILNKIQHITWEYTEFTLKKKYPKLFEMNYLDHCEEKLLNFKERIDMSVNFCKSFYNSAKLYTKKLKESSLPNQLNIFF